MENENYEVKEENVAVAENTEKVEEKEKKCSCCGGTSFGEVIKNMFTKNLSVGIALSGLIVAFLAMFFSLVGAYRFSLWVEFIACACVVFSVVLEGLKFVAHNNELCAKGNFAFVIIVSLIVVIMIF